MDLRTKRFYVTSEPKTTSNCWSVGNNGKYLFFSFWKKPAVAAKVRVQTHSYNILFPKPNDTMRPVIVVVSVCFIEVTVPSV